MFPCMALALPKLRWLIIGAVAAGVWVVREDMKGPRPPENVRPKVERSAEAKPRPLRQVTTDRQPEKPAAVRTQAERPVPPAPVVAKPVAAKPAPPKPVATQTALALPSAVDRPPAKPENTKTGSIGRAAKPVFVQTKAKVRLRAQARADAAVIVTLEARTVMREVARSGQWRLVVGDGKKGWVRADYLADATYLSRRPKLPVAEVKENKSASGPRPKVALGN